MKNLKELRKKAGLTQLRLADLLGVTEDAVCAWEAGRRNPSRRHLEKIKSFFNVSWNEIMDSAA